MIIAHWCFPGSLCFLFVEVSPAMDAQIAPHLNNRRSGRPSSAAVTEKRRFRRYAAPKISVKQACIYVANDLRLRGCAGRS